MVSQLLSDLERALPAVRLENYRPSNGNDLEMVVNYFFNIELSEALYPTLQAFEISLRNSIHATLTAHFSTAHWFDQPSFLPHRQARQVVDARTALAKESKPDTPDRIIAELHFGFWHSMFNSPFEQDLWRPNRSGLVKQVFPHASNRQSNRQDMWDRIDRIRIIRNLVMHYEPIWCRARLQTDHEAILEALYWINPPMHETIAMCDRFASILASGKATLAQKLKNEIARRYQAS